MGMQEWGDKSRSCFWGHLYSQSLCNEYFLEASPK